LGSIFGLGYDFGRAFSSLDLDLGRETCRVDICLRCGIDGEVTCQGRSCPMLGAGSAGEDSLGGDCALDPVLDYEHVEEIDCC
jgi:hypothetical protein